MGDITLENIKSAMEKQPYYLPPPGTKENPLLVYPAQKKRFEQAGYIGYMMEIGKLK